MHQQNKGEAYTVTSSYVIKCILENRDTSHISHLSLLLYSHLIILRPILSVKMSSIFFKSKFLRFDVPIPPSPQRLRAGPKTRLVLSISPSVTLIQAVQAQNQIIGRSAMSSLE